MPRYAVPPPPPPSSIGGITNHLSDLVQDLFEDWISSPVWLFAGVVLIAGLVGRYGLMAVVTAPVTFAMWLYHSIRSFRPPQFILVFGTSLSEFTDTTADKVVRKASAEAAKQQHAGQQLDDIDPVVDDNNALAAPPNAGAAQRAPPQNLRNRRPAAPPQGDSSSV